MQYVSCYNISPALCEHESINNLYARARNRARWGQLWSALTGRSDHLLVLAEIEAVGPLGVRRHTGLQTVPIRHIGGSQGRVHDFDRNFRPLKDHNKDRWLSVAGARQRGKSLPPVDLIQVGSIYFVQDGHHRISVARALGQRDIEAQVTVWGVTGPLPGEGFGTRQEIGIHGLARKVRDGSGSSQMQRRLLLTLREHLIALGVKRLSWERKGV